MRNPVASAPCSFGVDEVMEDDAWMPGPEEVLTWMAELGYEGTELGPPGYLGHGAQVRERLERRGLALVGSFLPQHLSRADLAPADRDWLRATLSDLRLATPAGSQPFAVLCEGIDEPLRLAHTGRIHEVPEARLDGERWDTLVDNLHRAAELCREEGFEPVFHPHAGTYIETADEIDRLVGRIDPSLVGLCLDTGHFRYGGAIPAQAIRDYRTLIRHVHLKDCDTSVLRGVVERDEDLAAAIAGGVFCPLGTGDADIPGAIVALDEIGYEGWLVVEQDRFLTPADTPQALLALHTRNRAWLRVRGF